MEMWQAANAVVQFYWNIQTGEKFFKRSRALVLRDITSIDTEFWQCTK